MSYAHANPPFSTSGCHLYCRLYLPLQRAALRLQTLCDMKYRGFHLYRPARAFPPADPITWFFENQITGSTHPASIGKPSPRGPRRRGSRASPYPGRVPSPGPPPKRRFSSALLSYRPFTRVGLRLRFSPFFPMLFHCCSHADTHAVIHAVIFAVPMLFPCCYSCCYFLPKKAEIHVKSA